MDKKVKLFFIIPIYEIKESASKKIIKILGIRVLTKKVSGEGRKIKYTMFGIPLLKINVRSV